jgi:thioredoxin-related protein
MLQQRAFAQGNLKSINWYSYDKGIAMSKEEGKKIFLYFWAEWCSYCTTMAKETFVDSSVIDYLNSHFISIKVDFDREKKAASDYEIRGLPSTWFISERGDKIGNRPGFISAKELLPMLKYIYSDSYKTMTLKTFLKQK